MNNIDGLYNVYIVLIISICLTINFVFGTLLYYKYRLPRLDNNELHKLNSDIILLIESNNKLANSYDKIQKDMSSKIENLKNIHDKFNLSDRDKKKIMW
jgi:hypothetical protein